VENYFSIALIYLVAALAVVPLAKRSGLGAVLGYLIAGIIIGPSGLSLVGNQEALMHFAEFGVVVLLFLIGLELNLGSLLKLRQLIIGLGASQVVLTAAFISLIAYVVLGDWRVALATGMVLAGSSTAIVLQTYAEKGWMQLPGGRAGFSVLLFQDMAVIPIIIGLPLLAPISGVMEADMGHAGYGHGGLAPLWQVVLVIAGVIAAGYFLVRPFFRYIAASQTRELFTVAALALVVGINKVMTMVGLSPALGAFVAGVVLAENEYRHEIESDLEPFRGLLMGLFFLTVGAGLDLALLGDELPLIVVLVVTLLLTKGAVLWLVAKAMKLDRGSRWMLITTLGQAGEFAFVLLGIGEQTNVFAPRVADMLTIIVTLSMIATPLLVLVYELLIVPRLGEDKSIEPDAEALHQSSVIVAGFGRVGQVVSRMLMSQGIKPVLLDFDASQVDLARRLSGMRVYYGDAARVDLLESAGAKTAKLLVVAVDDVDKSLEIVDAAIKHFPSLKIVARARNRPHLYQLLGRDVAAIQRETFGSSIDLGTDALRVLGMEAKRAERASQSFRRYDEQIVHEMSQYWGDEKQYGAAVRRNLATLKETLEKDMAQYEAELTDSAESVPVRDDSPNSSPG